MKSPTNKAERNAAVLARYQDGGSYRGIAKEFGISAVRVQQLIEAERKPDKCRCDCAVCLNGCVGNQNWQTKYYALLAKMQEIQAIQDETIAMGVENEPNG